MVEELEKQQQLVNSLRIPITFQIEQLQQDVNRRKRKQVQLVKMLTEAREERNNLQALQQQQADKKGYDLIVAYADSIAKNKKDCSRAIQTRQVSCYFCDSKS